MIDRRTVRENFSRAAARYDANARLQAGWRARVAAQALALVSEHAHLVDVGCGTGSFAQEVAAHRPHWRVAGIDLAYGMCAQAKRHGIAIQADAAALPIADAACDGVVSSLCLQWAANKAQAFQEIVRVLKPGAHAIVMTLGAQSLTELRACSAALKIPLRLLAMESPEQYAAYAAQAGLSLVTMESATEQHEYTSFTALLRSFKAIGAQAAFGESARALTPSDYAALSSDYTARYGTAQGKVAASWQPVLMVMQKTEHA